MNSLTLVSLSLLAVCSPSAYDFTVAPPQPAFATVTIAPAPPAATARGLIRLQPGGGFTATNATLRELVEYAYQRHAFDRREVTGGPAWIHADRFDVRAKAPAEHAVDADGGFRETWSMLRTLLADRFKVTLHEEERDRPVYVLKLANKDGTLGPKLQKTEVDCGAIMKGGGSPPSPGKGPPCSTKNPPGRLFATTASLPSIASLLSHHVDRIVVDKTGLTGRFDLELEAHEIKASPDYKPGPSDLALPPPGGPAIVVAVREQLGLELQPEVTSVPVIVIESAERPTFD